MQNKTSSLPNDALLRKNPFSLQPPLWDFNDDFVGLLKNLDTFWQKRNIEWRFGIEHEFYIDFDLDKQKEYKERHVTNSKIEDYIAALRKEKERSNPKTIEELRGTKFEKFVRPAESFEEEIIRMEGILKKRRSLKDDIIKAIKNNPAYTDEEKIRKTAKINSIAVATPKDGNNGRSYRDLFMAALHEIWLTNEVEYRFGTEIYGKGYYDNAGVSEIRTKPLLATQALAAYHQMVSVVSEKAAEYGFYIYHYPNAHIHMSAHERQSEKVPKQPLRHALTTFDDKKKVRFKFDDKEYVYKFSEFFQRTVEGVYSFMRDAACLYHVGCDTLNKTTVGHSRGDAIRMLENRFEFRFGQRHEGTMHLPMLLSFLLAGATFGLLDQAGERTRLETVRHGKFITREDIEPEYKRGADYIANVLNESVIDQSDWVLPGTYYICHDHDITRCLAEDGSGNPYQIMLKAFNNIFLHGKFLRYDATADLLSPQLVNYISSNDVKLEGELKPSLFMNDDDFNIWLGKYTPPYQYAIDTDCQALLYNHCRSSPVLQRMLSATWLPGQPNLHQRLLESTVFDKFRVPSTVNISEIELQGGAVKSVRGKA